MRRTISLISLLLALFVWSVFALALTIAVLAGRDASFCFFASFVHLVGVVILPILSICSFFLTKPRKGATPALALTIIYLIVTLWLYPLVVERYLATHPGWSGMHWARGNFPDYQYIENNPLGDPQYFGQVNLFPPYFDIPPKEEKGRNRPL